MSEMENRNGRVPTSDEFFDHCLLIADITEQGLLDSQALRDEVRRTLSKVIEQNAQGNAASLKKNQELALQLQQMYMPASVEKAAADANVAVAKFGRGLSSVFADVKQEADAVARTFWLRTAGAAAVVMVGLFATVAAALFLIPSMNEIQSRRAELASLNIRIYDHDGGKWTPIRDTITQCAKNDPSDCVKFGRIL